MAAVPVHPRMLIFAIVLSWISLDPAWGATDPSASWTNGPAQGQAFKAAPRDPFPAP
jgi:hypothetical protein